jgi:hypothetical protein
VVLQKSNFEKQLGKGEEERGKGEAGKMGGEKTAVREFFGESSLELANVGFVLFRGIAKR